MKKYEDPEMNVVLFNDRTFVNNGVGTKESSGKVGNENIPFGEGDLDDDEDIS